MITNAGQFLTERAKASKAMLAQVDLTTGARTTYHEMNLRANQLGNALLAKGLAPGTRVGWLMTNCPEYTEGYYGCAKAGFIFVALNWRLSVPELAYQIHDSGISIMVYSSDLLALVEPLKEQFPQLMWLPRDQNPFAQEVHLAPGNEPPQGAANDDPLYIMYTSGTTGKPKGAVHTHRSNIEWSYRMLASGDTRLGDRQIIVAPLFHIGGLGVVMAGVFRGCTAYIAQGFDPGAMWDIIEKERITTTFLVPVMLNFMYQHPKRKSTDYQSLRSILCGAAPVPTSLIEAYSAMGIEILQVYGSTETHGGICVITPDFAQHKIGSTGLPFFGVDIRVVDSDGQDVAPGVPGEVITRGPHLFKEYWNQPEATISAFRDGWFYIGDIGVVDDDGYLYIKDRSKDMIISGAENIYPAEIEDVLQAHPMVKEVAVIGQPSPKWGESPAAVVVPKKEASPQEPPHVFIEALRQHIEGKLARYKHPKAYYIVETIPRNPSGKILKRLLREQFPGPAPE
jgi:acyl-CoA synthetase (AMP-forming)/AMP-acid ligase II